MAEQNLQSWFWDMSLPSPQVAGLLNKAIFSFSNQHLLLEYWLSNGEQLNLSSITFCSR